MLHYCCKLKALDSRGADNNFQGVTPPYSQIILGRNVLWEVWILMHFILKIECAQPEQQNKY